MSIQMEDSKRGMVLGYGLDRPEGNRMVTTHDAHDLAQGDPVGGGVVDEGVHPARELVDPRSRLLQRSSLDPAPGVDDLQRRFAGLPVPLVDRWRDLQEV